MTNEVQFEIDSVRRPMVGSRRSTLSRWVAEHSGGLIRNEDQASIILVLVAIVLIIMAINFAMNSTPVEPISGAVPAGQIVP